MTVKPDLKTTYLGLELKNPLMAAPSPLTGELPSMKALEDAGASAIVLPSLFEEQIEHEEIQAHRLDLYGAESFHEAQNYFPDVGHDGIGPDSYLDRIRRAKEHLSIPVVASLNGHTAGGWVHYAQLLEQAGADALELNIYYIPTEIGETGAEVESHYLDLLRRVREEVQLPLAVKIGPAFSSLANMAKGFEAAGADGLVMFNRFLEPDIELDTLHVVPKLELSSHQTMRLALRWTAIMYGQVDLSIATTGGAHSSEDAIKLILAGSDVVMMASTLLRHGPHFMAKLVDELSFWLEDNEYVSVQQAKGSMSRMNCPDPSSFERVNYMKALASFTSEMV
ncbi:MAG: dihydroorotate dehydrogenase-like protein [Planctomycetota bacterium]|nr:MAG: dihydroorotate dehydrogenase-like protein [Planctomycetota bacterium]